MAPTTGDRRRRQAGASTARRFSTIILDPLANTQKIPAKFCEKYALPSCVSLKVVGVFVSEVGLVRSNGETFLSQGWNEFKERHSLEHGGVLVFEYDGVSGFDVLVFDLSGSEIHYRVDRVIDLEDSEEEEEEDEDDNEEADEEEANEEDEASAAYEKAVSYTRANASSLNPFFITKMKKSCVKGYSMHFSLSFAKEFLPCTASTLTIRLANGKTWRVKYTVGKYYAGVHGGWRSFVRHSRLKVGDACLFEVVDHFLLNVIIFRK